MKIYILLLLILTWAITYIINKHKTKKRIEELSLLIENLNDKNYKINMKQDEFSKLEDDIYKLFLQIVEERENTKKLYLSQSENLEDIAHQIKTPITAILFQIENMEIEEDKIKGLKYQIDRLNTLTDALLKLSSLDANINKMKKDRINIEELIFYALDILDGDIKEKKAEIEMRDINEIVTGDYYWLSEAIINILKNSINVSENKKIKIYSKSNPIYTQVFIEDFGGGIKIKNKNLIFKRFYKTPDSKGFGIGLAMAKTIIEANNGEIEVENTKEGALFKIKFYKVT